MTEPNLSVVLQKLADILQNLPISSAANTNAGNQGQKGDVRGLQLAPFDEANENFDTYFQRLQNYLELRDLSDETNEGDKKCVQILINCLGPKLFHTLTCLTAPEQPKSLKYSELTALLRAHLCPTPSEIAEQHKFSLRVQHEGESISNYQAELKKLSTNCNFVCASCKKSTNGTHLRSQFVRGVRDNDIRERLLQQDASKTFEDAVKLALSIESSKMESREMCSQPLHYIGKQNSPKQGVDQSNRGTKQNSSRQSSKPQFKKLQHIRGRCFKCGKTDHMANKCKQKNLKCSTCHKRGHVQSVCLSNKSTVDHRAVKIGKNSDSDSDSDNHFLNIVAICNSLNSDKYFVQISINGLICTMEYDTGAAVSTVSLQTFQNNWPHNKLHPTSIQLKTYTGEIVKPVGMAKVKVNYENKEIYGNLYVLQENVDSILGREWIRSLKIEVSSLHQIRNCDISESECKKQLQKALKEFDDIFTQEIGKIPSFKCTLQLRGKCQPTFIRPRPIPYALKGKIDHELDRLEKAGIIEKIIYSKWGTPIVPVIKKNGDIRLCADYKVTINKEIDDDNYPIPKIDEILSKMSGGKYFITLDLHQAYLHMEMDEESSLLQAISTHRGNYKVKRLMFGVKPAPKRWQRFMDSVLQDMDGVACFFDDITIQGATYIQLLQRLRAVLHRLRAYDLHLNKSKCQFLLSSITYLGHVIDKEGIRPVPEKIEAITKCERPEDVQQLRTFLGLINYYQKFLPNLASRLKPLHNLLQKGTAFKWSEECDNLFNQLKRDITSTKILVTYNERLPIILATDASPHGLGAVISHQMSDGTERPIAFASRSLSKSERNYSQLDKEATSIYWGLKKFFQFCYGRKITLLTDHKPLTAILNPNKNLPATSAIRLLRYASFMSGFDYIIKYRDTKSHANADFLSRFPMQGIPDKHNRDDSIFQISQIETLPVTLKDIQREILKDTECRSYYNALQQGDPMPNQESSYKFSIEKGCVFNGIRVMIPKVLQQHILKELHEAHIGIVRMKALARSYVWWKGIDRDIEDLARKCRSCCQNKTNPSKVTPHPWEYPTNPWQRIHIDYAGPFYDQNFLIIVDAYTKWIEAVPTKSITSKTTIKILREIFARFGLPLSLVSDNATSFTSNEFRSFLKSNGITHRLCAPYHPSSNGQAERYVQTIKQGIRTMMYECGDVNEKLCRFLMQYRKVPNSTTGLSPAELMFKRSIRTRIDLVKKDVATEMNERQRPSNTNTRVFEIGDKVQVRFYNNKCIKWKFGIVIKRKGDSLYDILINNEKHTRHVDQLRPSDCEPISNDKPHSPFNETTNNDLTKTEQENLRTNNPQVSGPARGSDNNSRRTQQTAEPTDDNTEQYRPSSPIAEENERVVEDNKNNPKNSTMPTLSPQLRRSTRIRQQPKRFQLQ